MKNPFKHIGSNLTPVCFHNAMVLLAFSSIFLFVASCSDETISTAQGDSRLIRFEINEATADMATTTRGSMPSSTSVVPLGDNSGLFLVSKTEDQSSVSDCRLSPTRSEIINSDNITSFGVFAGYASEATSPSYLPNYMSNEKICRSSGWAPEDEYLWPGDGALHFNAYSPYFSPDEKSNQGITGIEKDSGNLSINYSVPADVAQQKELLYATPIDASSSPCHLTFNHALTAIKFSAGSELTACTVKSITVSGVKATASLNLESGQWNNLSTEESFTVSPQIEMIPEAGSGFVKPDTPITSDDDIFLLIPQTLEENAKVSVTLDINGKESILDASISGQVWQQGKTVTYRISANPEADSLVLDVTGDFKAEYTGSNLSFNVKSSYDDGTTQSQVGWVAEFVDDSGKAITQPSWIEKLTSSAAGDTVGEITTTMNEIVFDDITPESKTLQQASDINASSGNTPYNLSSSTGSTSVENTANTYIINAPGNYSLPLVYGNAIKNSSINKGAYTATTHHANTLKVFTNHLGNAISSPYIYENTGCTPKEAVLIWEDELNLVRNVRLSSDGEYLLFDVPQNTIRQGNALVAIKDGDGKVIWSWQLWITDYKSDTGTANISVSGKNYKLSSENLGYIAGGDVTTFPECSVKIRFTQTGLPDGVEPLSKTVELYQSGATISTPECNTFYQWGRKDPMMSSVKQWYSADHKIISELPTQNAELIATSDLVEYFIQNPGVFFTGSHQDKNETPYPYQNLWNVNYSAANVKSIYDPSPVGFVVPENQPFNFLGSYSVVDGVNRNTNVTVRYVDSSSSGEKKGYYLRLISGGEDMFFPALGYRSGSQGSLNEGSVGIWTAHSTNVRVGGYFGIESLDVHPLAHTNTDPLFHAFSIRPIKE